MKKWKSYGKQSQREHRGRITDMHKTIETLFLKTFSPEHMDIAIAFHECDAYVSVEDAPTVEHRLVAEPLIEKLGEVPLIAILEVIQQCGNGLVVAATPLDALTLSAVAINATLVSFLLCSAAAVGDSQREC